MGTFSVPTHKTRQTRALRTSASIYRPPIGSGELARMIQGSVIESQHAPKRATLGASYADIMATSPPPKPVESLVAIIRSPLTDESDLSPEPETVRIENVESLYISGKPVVALPVVVTSPPESFPKVPSEISTFELPSPVSTRQSSTVEEKCQNLDSKSAPQKESVLFSRSETFTKRKRYGAFVFAKGDPDKLERLNQKGTKLESRWAC